MKKILISIILIISAVFIFANGKNETGLEGFKGNVKYLEGEVSINGAIAQLRSVVSDNDIIKTGKNSYCDVVFNKGNIFHLEPDTVIVIKMSETRFEIKSGAMAAVFSRLKNILPKKKMLTLHTPSASAGIRGTVFYIRVEDQNNSYICTCNGTLELNSGTKSFWNTSKHHKAFRFTKENDSIKVSSAGLLYHTDAEMDHLAGEINTTIPWVKNTN